MASKSVMRRAPAQSRPDPAGPLIERLIREARENREGPAPAPPALAQAVRGTLDLLLAGFDYEADPKSPPAMIARSLAALAGWLEEMPAAGARHSHAPTAESTRERLFEVEALIRSALEQIGGVEEEGHALGDAQYVLGAARRLACSAAEALEGRGGALMSGAGQASWAEVSALTDALSDAMDDMPGDDLTPGFRMSQETRTAFERALPLLERAFELIDSVRERECELYDAYAYHHAHAVEEPLGCGGEKLQGSVEF